MRLTQTSFSFSGGLWPFTFGFPPAGAFVRLKRSIFNMPDSFVGCY
jgi:hypothetical protein